MTEPGSSGQPQRRRRIAPALARWTLCIAAVSWLIHDIEWDQVARVLSEAQWGLALLGLLAFGPTPILISLRLKWLLAVHDVHLTFRQAIKVTFAGHFLIQALPIGTSGGDSLKAYYVARDTEHKHEAVMTVFFDRVVGVVALVGMSGLLVLLNWGKPEFERWGRIIGVSAMVLGVLGICYFSNHIRAFLRLDSMVARLPLSAHLQRLDRALFAFRHRVGRLGVALGLTGVLQVVAIFAMFLVGRALGMKTDAPGSDLLVFLAYTPICFLSGALPIGAMEVVFVELFADAAGLGTSEQAVSLSLLSRIVQLIWALPGAITVLEGRPDHDSPELLES